MKTTTYAAGTPNSATKVETYARDGSLLSVTGSATHPERYLITNSGGSRARRTIHLSATGADLNQWEEERLDTIGRFRNYWSSSYANLPILQVSYNNNGQIWKRETPDGQFITTFNGKGEAVTNALDLNINGTIEPAGTDRLSRTVSDVLTAHGTVVRRSRTYVWPTNNVNSSVLASTVETSADGLKRWETIWGQTTTTEWSSPINGSRTRTTTFPNNTWTLDSFSYGRLVSSTQYDSNSVQLAQASYGYDPLGRLISVTDSRNGTAFSSFDNLDRLTTTTAPQPGTGSPALTTSYGFDDRDRIIQISLPDGGVITNEYFVTGELKKTYGTRTYPIEYVYDTLGRVRTNTTWQNFSSSAGAASTVWNYDATSGLLTSKRYNDNTGPNYTYLTSTTLKRHKVSTRTWARGTVATYGYNNAGEPSNITYNTGTSLTDRNLAYDRLGRLITAQIGPDNNAVTLTNQFAYGPEPVLLKETHPGNSIVTNTYDSLLRRASVAMHGQSATLETIGYEPGGRLGSVTNGTHAISFGYVPAAPGLLASTTFKNSGTTRLIQTKSYDLVNRLLTHNSVSGSGTAMNWSFNYDQGNQRTRADLADGSYWVYEYDSLGQLISGKRFWNDGTPVAGQQFEYTFDSIGNRTATKAGGDDDGNNLRSATYVANLINETTNRTVPGAIDVMGVASATAAVTVNGQSTYRNGEYYRKELSVSNGSGGVWQSITNTATQGSSTTVIGNAWLDQTPQVFKYDADGNLTNDGRWTFTWDVENRLMTMEAMAVVPSAARKKLDFTYDVFGRRIQKKVSTWNGSAYVAVSTNKFVYDGWNLVATLDAASSLQYGFIWANDLSGSWAGAGGVGGLVGMVIPSGGLAGTYYYAFDGNGNVVGLVNGANGDVAATYEYGPFGEVLRASGSLAGINPFRFSTKYQDDESELVYYGYRYYSASHGRWISRDPIEEAGGLNLSGFVGNNPVLRVDPSGKEWFNAVKTAIGELSASTKEAVLQSSGNWVAKGTIATVLDMENLAIQSIPNFGESVASSIRFAQDPSLESAFGPAIANFGSGFGAFYEDPSWENAGGLAQDISTLSSVLAGLRGGQKALRDYPGGARGFLNNLRTSGRVSLDEYKRLLCKLLSGPNDAKGTRQVLDGLPTGKQSHVRTVKTEADLKALHDQLTTGGTSKPPGGYPGTVTKLPDGTVIRMRPGSKSGGSTIDITYPDGKLGKVHIE
ncbi:MAG: RHS repeat-associated core domain-containing protein [Verrucomicrobiales bacterium]|nr:RHS repeat-associated core domain-containing protein [Verrucomicrobiales bacterium]